MSKFQIGLVAILGLLASLFIAPSTAHAQTQSTPDTHSSKRVVIGAFVNDIQAIDLRTHSYVVDLYLWFRWTDPDFDPSKSFEFMNTFDPEAHVETEVYERPQEQPDGSYYAIIRHQGAFSNKFDVSDYPFDRQNLIVSVEDNDLPTQELVYVADKNALVINQEIRLPGYDIGRPRLIIRDKPYDTNFGDLSEPETTPYSRAEFTIPISRPATSGIVKSFMPVLLIILCAALALVLDPSHVEARVGLAITALLTLVATQFTAAGSLPEVSYLTLLDQIYILSYLYILTVIGMVVRGTRRDSIGLVVADQKTSTRFIEGGPRSALISTLIYIFIVAAILIGNLI